MDNLPRYSLPKRNFVSPYPRTGGGLPPTPTPRTWVERIGNWLNIPEPIVIRGQHNRGHLYRLLRFRGVRVRSIRVYGSWNAPWWKVWERDTYVVVERHYGGMAMEILEAEGYEILNGDNNE
jgi:hypothetical protein